MPGRLLQAHSQHLLGYERPPYPPDLLGLPYLPDRHPPACLAAANRQPVDTQADAAFGHPGSSQQALAPLSETPLAAQDTASHDAQSLPAGSSDAAACNDHAATAHEHPQAAAKVQPTGGAEALKSGTTRTEASPAGGGAWSIASVPVHVHHMAGSHEEINAQSVQACSTDPGSAMTVPQQHNGEQQQQTNTVAGGSVAEASSPQGPAAGGSPGQSNAGLWTPMSDFPVYSITEVAFMQLLPEFLEDIRQVVSMLVCLCMCACLLHSRSITQTGGDLSACQSLISCCHCTGRTAGFSETATVRESKRQLSTRQK